MGQEVGQNKMFIATYMQFLYFSSFFLQTLYSDLHAISTHC